MDYALIVGAVALLLLLITSWYLKEDVQLCLADKRTSVILVLYSEACITDLSESAVDGHPPIIDHPPKCG